MKPSIPFARSRENDHVILPEKYILQTNTFQHFQNNVKSPPYLYVIYINLLPSNICPLKENLATSTHSHHKIVLKQICRNLEPHSIFSESHQKNHT